MKKNYKKPLMEIVDVELHKLICVSTTESGASVNNWTEDEWPDDTEDSESQTEP